MKTIIFSIGFIFSFSVLLAQQDVLEIARERYFSIHSDCEWLELYKEVKDETFDNTTLLAYKGASEIASASCIKGGLKKLKFFRSGKQSLEEAVLKDPDNLEIRFLRYAVKINAPGFLNYNDYLPDEEFILEHIDDYLKKNKNLKHSLNIGNFMIEYGRISSDRKEKIKELIHKYSI